MAFPAIIQGSPGMEKTTTSAKKNRIGARMILPDGREFVYAYSGEAITAGKVTMQPQTASDHIKDLAVASAVSAGATQMTVTNGGSTAITGSGSYDGSSTTVGDYEDGYIFVNDVNGEGQIWQIKNHSSAATSATLTVNIYDTDKVATALTTSSQVGLAKNPHNGVEVWDVNDIDGIAAGVPACDITANYYFWNQVKGPAAVLTNGTVVLGKNVMTGSTTDGSVDVVADDSSAEFIIGGVMGVAATTEYSLVWLNIGA
tara:strand:+ start:1260 stop:2033 length:774 start_codon:yes stop_codon:yes gene_type:complete